MFFLINVPLKIILLCIALFFACHGCSFLPIQAAVGTDKYCYLKDSSAHSPHDQTYTTMVEKYCGEDNCSFILEI